MKNMGVPTKKAKLLEYIARGDKLAAFRLVSSFSFGLSDEEFATVRRAHEFPRNRAFYESLGFQYEAERGKAWEIILRTYSKKPGSH